MKFDNDWDDLLAVPKLSRILTKRDDMALG
jgi:hypothetical protein